MATTLVRNGLRVQQWDDTFFREYSRTSKFFKYTGTDESSIIQVKEDLMRKPGDSLTFQMVGRLKQAATRGNVTLAGREEAMNTRSQRVYVELVRHATAIDTEIEQIKTDIDLRMAGDVVLRTWHKEQLRTDIIDSMMSIDGVKFSLASATQRNTWLSNNRDRALFGATKSNAVSNVHATAMTTIDNTNDKLTPAAISLMKRFAKSADPRISPISVKQDEEWFVMFVNTLSFRDLANNANMVSANTDARARGMDNPLWTGGDLVWDGVIIKEIEEMPITADVGAGGTVDVGPAILCGAQAIGMAIAQRSESIEDTPRDFGRILPIGVSESRGIQKLRFGTAAGSASVDLTTPKDFGMVTGWFAAEPDA